MNAKEACVRLGVDGNGMEAKWAKLDKSKEMIKFGGGFYCGKVSLNTASILRPYEGSIIKAL